MKDLGQLHHFLGVTVEPRPSDLLHQRQYALDILERAGMTDCKPCSTPVDTQAKLSADLGAPVSDPTAYQSLAGALQYLTITRLESQSSGVDQVEERGRGSPLYKIVVRMGYTYMERQIIMWSLTLIHLDRYLWVNASLKTQKNIYVLLIKKLICTSI